MDTEPSTVDETGNLPSLRTTPHINRAKVKQTALDLAKTLRPANHFERVGASFYEAVEAEVRRFVASRIKSHPSKGVTLK
jgi:hypothetical protein